MEMATSLLKSLIQFVDVGIKSASQSFVPSLFAYYVRTYLALLQHLLVHSLCSRQPPIAFPECQFNEAYALLHKAVWISVLLELRKKPVLANFFCRPSTANPEVMSVVIAVCMWGELYKAEFHAESTLD
jgi:hypothetical protein